MTAFRAAAAAAGSTTANLTIPGTVAAGDSMLLLVSTNGVNPATPSGWAVASAAQQAGTGVISALYKRIAVAGDGGTVVALSNDGAAGATMNAVLVAHSGTDTVEPVHAVQATTATTTSASRAAPAVTTTKDGCWIIEMVAVKHSSLTDFTPPAAMTERQQSVTTGSGKSACVAGDSNGPKAPGSYGPDTWTSNVTTGSAIMYTVALAPATTTQTTYPSTDVMSSLVAAVPTPGAGIGLYSVVDEAIANDADYLEFSNNGVWEGQFSALVDPQSNTGHTLTFRQQLASGATEGTWTTEVRQGSTVIASWTDDATASVTPISHTLTGTQADAITDYNDLRVRIALSGLA